MRAALVETVLTYRDDALPDALRWQAGAFVRATWPEVGGGAARDPYPRGLDPLHVVLVEGDLLLAYAGVVAMRVAHGGQAWRVDGLGRVFTFPGARGAGRGRRVVDAASAAIVHGGADLGALLCEPGLRPFYAGSGWGAVEPGVLIDAGDGTPTFAVEGPTMLLPVSARAQEAWRCFREAPLRVPFAW
ncbi:GNAT family N-acetyltransferase [Microlunatus flavus]|uniref:Acetyltransferase (GNAT) domain-containing protein n=1 Tax=Microlunatus flavus TaxID=1036181 RepID=A0A1H9JI02_9ACTN|nr:GNAT family N-acetyltransferase [Microlunatus flavus]SEQ86611.1 Acetyltransferase (GNAT) domain-containing protein [Microlunatus flavus]